jgi:tetratricopeptide (TPR) repeat protein
MAKEWSRRFAGLFGLLVAASAADASAQVLEPALATPGAEARYATAPEPWRSFLIKARAASEINDPLQRCKAIPVLPETHWPAGMIERHCEYSLGVPDFAPVKAHIVAGDAKWLDTTFRALLARHFSEKNFSEHIHDVLDRFDGEYESGRLSKLWLELDPHSPFALTARGNFYLQLGWRARGSATIGETPPEQLEQMEVHHRRAVELYGQALAKEPRMLPAYVGLLDIARNGSGSSAVFEAARKIDPACKALLSGRMDSLKPRWGGSYPQMLDLEKQMLPFMAKRPLLSLSRVWPYQDMANTLSRAGQHAEAVKALAPMLDVSSSPQIQEDLALEMLRAGSTDNWRILAYLVSASRFRVGRSDVAYYRGGLALNTAYDLPLAHRDLERSTQDSPERAQARYFYGAVLSAEKRFDQAIREYEAALRYDEERGDTYISALMGLMTTQSLAGRFDKAVAYANRYATEFPTRPLAWLTLASYLATSKAPVAAQRTAYEKYLALVDRKDPGQRYSIDRAEAYLRDTAAQAGKKPR